MAATLGTPVRLTAKKRQKNPSSTPARLSMITAIVLLAATGGVILGASIQQIPLPFNTGATTANLLAIVSFAMASSMALAYMLSETVRYRGLPNPPEQGIPTPTPLAPLQKEQDLDVEKLLMEEFKYARETAAQAMEERRTVINFYLLIVGASGSGIVALLPTVATHPPFLIAAAALLWVVVGVGWLTLFQIISLRLAWLGSANAMRYVKEFYLAYAQAIPQDILKGAFFFRTETLPDPHKHWNTIHFSAVQVSFLNSAALVAGATLFALVAGVENLGVFGAALCLLALVYFFAHLWVYDIALIKREVKA